MKKTCIFKGKRADISQRTDKTDWDALAAMTEEEIEANALSDADNLPLDADFWRNAQIVHPRHKSKISIRLDDEVLDYFRHQGSGYQSRINAVLRSYIEAQGKL